MKKYLLLFILPFIFLNNVYADVTDGTYYIFPIENETSFKPNQNSIDYIYNTLIPNYPNKDYIIITMPFSLEYNYIQFFTKTENDYLTFYGDDVPQIQYYISSTVTECVVTNSSNPSSTCSTHSDTFTGILQTRYPSAESSGINWYGLYDTNLTFNSLSNFEMTGFYSDNIVVNQQDNLPHLKDLYEYNSWSDYENNHLVNYTTVNLDNYEYVLLSLKDYSQKNPFQTNLQVKGQIGITPIYNYGQTTKDSVTGVQVQDRCNLSYTDYTAYPFYIIQSDLQNNAIFAVKSCSSNSSFKFDNSIFNIDYVTSQNKNNPTVTINGTTYNVIPYDNLPSSATENEENNYIPGESGSAVDSGGLDSAVKSIQKRMSEIWNTFTYFTDFIGQIFSALPSELSTILLSAFIVAITLGLIKIFIN